MENKIIYGLYDDDDVLLNAARQIMEKGVRVKNVYSPFPVHGLDRILRVKWTRLAICSFLFGLTGTALALFGMWYFMIYDWPINVGGKPNFTLYENMLAFIPVTFEFAVLCAGHGMALAFLFRSWIFPGVTATNPDPRTTDDHFAVEIHTAENGEMSDKEIIDLLSNTGSVEVWEKGKKKKI